MDKQKKKCGMVTLYDDNYGTCLQAYALYSKLISLGVNPEIIKYNRCVRNASSQHKGLMARLKHMGLAGVIDYLKSYSFIKDRKFGFELFRKKYLTFTEETSYRDSLSIETIQRYDVFVCGSDMIWSEEFIDDWQFFYLDFVPSEKTISYAPSFGKNEISEDARSKCKEYLSRIRFRSCREEAGVEMIRQYFGMEFKQVVDPTILLDSSEWNELIGTKERLIEEKYTLTYVFGGLDGKRSNTFRQVQNLNLGKHRVIAMNRKQYNEKAFKGIIGPIEFLRLYRDSEFIITDTFHGLIFALIFQKPFIVLKREDAGHWAKYSDRMTSTLDMLGLRDRYVDSSTAIQRSICELDYSEINKILKRKREESLEYLGSSIREVLQ